MQNDFNINNIEIEINYKRKIYRISLQKKTLFVNYRCGFIEKEKKVFIYVNGVCKAKWTKGVDDEFDFYLFECSEFHGFYLYPFIEESKIINWVSYIENKIKSDFELVSIKKTPIK